MSFFGLDKYYLIIVVPAIIFALIAQFMVKSTYKKYSKVINTRGMTGASAAQSVLAEYGIYDVTIRPIEGNLTDNYNPQTKVLSLSKANFYGTSIAAVGVACHEVGHAIQHSQGYTPIKIRSAIVPICNIGSRLGFPLIIIGYLLGASFGLGYFGHLLISLGLVLYAIVAIFQFVTLPVEFNASSRAMKAIENQGLLYEGEISGARKVLTAAALTYVASLLVSLANLIRLYMRFNRR